MYLYHLVPQNLEGSTLYPLNALKEIYPRAYEYHKQKYRGRESLTEIVVPKTGALWNDFLHLTAIDFNDLKTLILKEFHQDAFPLLKTNRQYFSIDVKKLDSKKLFVFYNSRVDRPEDDYKINPDDVLPFEYSDDKYLATLSSDQVQDYRNRIASKEIPLLFSKTIHFLYLGTISLDKAVLCKIK